MRIVYKGNYIRMTCGEIGLVSNFNGVHMNINLSDQVSLEPIDGSN